MNTYSQLKISAALWGPGMWDHLIIYAFMYPDSPTLTQQQRATTFYTNLCIPCSECQNNYDALIQTNPPQCSSRQTLIDWIYQIHSADRANRNAENIPFTDFVKHFQDKHTLSDAMYKTGCTTCPSPPS
jgi:hypothetical protein